LYACSDEGGKIINILCHLIRNGQMKEERALIEKVSRFVMDAMQHHDSGHGWSHVERVVRMALHIHECEGRGDSLTVELGALLHDVGDHKFAAHDGPEEINRLLGSLGVH